MRPIVYIMIVLSLSLFLFAFYWNRAKGENDIYVDKYVFVKTSNKLFTGILKMPQSDEPRRITTMTFYRGKPLGRWECIFKGDIEMMGTYFDRTALSVEAQKFFGNDYVVDFYDETYFRSDSNSPHFLDVEVLKPDSFFASNKSNCNYANDSDYFYRAAKIALRGAGTLKCQIVSICLESDYFHARRYITYDYEVKNDNLIFKRKYYK